jgi:hypothetical protein
VSTTAIKRLIIAMGCAAVLFGLAAVHSPTAQAARGQVTINGATAGHAGTKIQLAGSGFAANTSLQLYTTTDNDPAHCTAGNAALATFTSTPTVMTQGRTFTLDTTWPDNAAVAGTAYFVCVLDPNSNGRGALSNNTFTVAPPATFALSTPTTAAGAAVTITGMNWVPPQGLTIALFPPGQGAAALTSVQANANADGTFSATLAIPPGTAAGSYSITVMADNEPTLKQVENGVLAVTAQATATTTPATTPTPKATASTTPTPALASTQPNGNANDTNQNNGTGSGGISSVLLYAMVALGLLFAAGGVTLFVIYTRGDQR